MEASNYIIFSVGLFLLGMMVCCVVIPMLFTTLRTDTCGVCRLGFDKVIICCVQLVMYAICVQLQHTGVHPWDDNKSCNMGVLEDMTIPNPKFGHLAHAQPNLPRIGEVLLMPNSGVRQVILVGLGCLLVELVNWISWVAYVTCSTNLPAQNFIIPLVNKFNTLDNGQTTSSCNQFVLLQHSSLFKSDSLFHS